MSESAPPTGYGGRDWLAAAGVALLTVAVFSPALRCAFINLDDRGYVTENKHVLAGLSADGATWAFTTFDEANWHPLTWLSLQLDATIRTSADGTPDPVVFHLTNVLLHAANAGLLFLALRGLTGAVWPSLAAALLFGVHPLRVESVAWVAERKDVLSAFFGLLALVVYARYVRTPSAGWNVAVAVCFALSLMAKPMLVTLPCLLLVLDWWPLGRWRSQGAWRLVREKLPLFALTVGSCVVTVVAQRRLGAVVDAGELTLGTRLANAIVSYAQYLWQTVWPTRMAVFYTHPGFSGVGLEAETVVLAGVLLLAISAAAIYWRRQAPYLLAGWLWYLGTLVPMIGLVQVGGQGRADRYTYVPQIGVLIAVVWGVAALLRGRTRLAVLTGAAATLALAAVTEHQLSFWQNSEALWGHALEALEPSPRALNNYGATLQDAGDLAAAVPYYQRARQMDTTDKEACFNLAVAMQRQGKLEEAARNFRDLCKLKPGSADAHSRLGDVYSENPATLDDAAREYRKALAIDPTLVGTLCNLGIVEAARNRLGEAADCYQAAIQLRPDFAPAREGMGRVLVRQGKLPEAIAEFREAIRCDANYAPAYNNLGDALERQGNLDDAAKCYEVGVRVNPKLARLWANLARARGRQKRFAEAIECLETAAAQQPRAPEFVAALGPLSQQLAAAGQFKEAAALARRGRDRAARAGWADLARQFDFWANRYDRGESGPPADGPS